MSVQLKARKRSLMGAVVLAILVVAVGGVSFHRKAQTFQPLGFEASPEVGAWRVVRVDSPASPLRAGDQILAINGQAVGELADPAAALRSRTTSELAVLRKGLLETLSHSLPPLSIDWPYLILALIGTIYLLIGFYTLLRDPKRPALLFYFWCLTSALLYLTSPVAPFDRVGKTIFLLDQLARILVAPLTLHLFAVFPRRPASRGRLARAIPFFYLPAALLLLLQTDLIFFNGVWLLGGAVERSIRTLATIELYHLVLFALAAVAVLLWRLRRQRQPEPFRQATWIAVGMAGGYLPFLALYVVPRTLELAWPQAVTSLAVLPLALVPLTFAYAILRYKLWDIGAIVRDTVTLSLTVLVGVIGFSLANLVINRVVPDEIALARTLVAFVSGLVIAGLLIPTRKGIGASLERLQYRDSFSKRRALVEFGREMLQERSLARLCTSLVNRLRSALDLQPTSLLLRAGAELEPVLPLRSPVPKIDPELFDPEFWQSDVEILSVVEFPVEDETPKQRLFAAGYRYAFPLQARDHRIGVLLAGYKEGEIPLSSDDLDLIRNLLNQAALAIENAQLLEEVGHRLEEVVRLQRYSQGIIESSPAGITVIDPQGRVLSANQAFAALVGREPGQLTGCLIRDVLPIGLPKPEEGIRETSLRDPDGQERYLQLTVAPLQDEEEKLRVVVVQDISERIEMENALKEKERLASLGMLAAGVAHEVNTPITGISSYAQMLLAETPEGDPRRELLRKVEKQTFRAARIVNNLLEFARDRQRERRPTALAPVIGECLELLDERLEEGQIELEWRPPTEEVQVMGNEDELQQVFTNLLVNAVDAMSGQAAGRLVVALEFDQRWVRAWVEDSGRGISHGELEKIFQPFFSTKLTKGGTGLGLSISFNIVRRHGGDLRVVSHPGEGTRFIVELPRYVT